MKVYEIAIGDYLTANKNGTVFTGPLRKIVICERQGEEGHYIEYRCDNFACHEREIVGFQKAGE